MLNDNRPLLQEYDEEQKKRCCACCTSGKLIFSAFLIAILGLGLIACAAFITPYIKNKLKDGINDFKILDLNAYNTQNDAWRSWSNPLDEKSTPEYMTAYVFNVTNPSEVLNAGALPLVHEIGPFVFREMKQRSNFQFTTNLDGQEILRYKEWQYYVYQPALSTQMYNLDTVVTVPNLAFLGVVNNPLAADDPAKIEWLFDFLIPVVAKQQINVSEMVWNQNKVSDLLFGFESPFLKKVNESLTILDNDHLLDQHLMSYAVPGFSMNQTELDSTLPPHSLYVGTNGDNALIRQYYEWYGRTDSFIPDGQGGGMTPWGTAAANRVRGGDGTMADKKPSDHVPCYVDQLFRSVHLQWTNEIVEHKGVKAHRYGIDPTTMQSVHHNPDNAAYYMYEYDGVLNMSIAFQGVPVYVTKPHMLDTDPRIASTVHGLSPNPMIHDTVIDIEPTSGATINAAKRLQINVRMGRMNWTEIAAGHPTQPMPQHGIWFPNMTALTVIPVAWMEESGSMKDDDASMFKKKVYVAQAAEHYISYVGYIIGNIFVAFAIIFATCALSRKEPRTIAVNTNAQLHY